MGTGLGRHIHPLFFGLRDQRRPLRDREMADMQPAAGKPGVEQKGIDGGEFGLPGPAGVVYRQGPLLAGVRP